MRKAHLAQLLDAHRQVVDLVERRALGQLEHDAVGYLRQRRRRPGKRLVFEITRVHIDEEDGFFGRLRELLGHPRANGSPEIIEPAQRFCRVQDGTRGGERGVARAHERFVSKERLRRASHDGVVSHPEPFDGALEAGFEIRPITSSERPALERVHRFAVQARRASEFGGAAQDLEQLRQVDRLGEVLAGAIANRIGG